MRLNHSGGHARRKTTATVMRITRKSCHATTTHIVVAVIVAVPI